MHWRLALALALSSARVLAQPIGPDMNVHDPSEPPAGSASSSVEPMPPVAPPEPPLGMIDLDRTPDPGLVDGIDRRSRLILRTSCDRMVRVDPRGGGVSIEAPQVPADGTRWVTLAPGDHTLWVSGGGVQVELQSWPIVDETALRPLQGRYAIPATGGSRELHGRVQGVVPAAMYGDACEGYVPREPLVALHASEPMNAVIEIVREPLAADRLRAVTDVTADEQPMVVSTQPARAAVLMLRAANGVWSCSVDDPLSLDLPVGDQLLWVGTRQPDEVRELRVRVSALSTERDALPTHGRVSLAHASVDRALRAVLDADLPGSLLNEDLVDERFGGAPLWTLHLEQPLDVALHMESESGDAFVYVRGRGLDEQPTGDLERWEAGDYAVYAGTVGTGSEPFVLHVRTRVSGIVPFVALPDEPSDGPAIDASLTDDAIHALEHDPPPPRQPLPRGERGVVTTYDDF